MRALTTNGLRAGAVGDYEAPYFRTDNIHPKIQILSEGKNKNVRSTQKCLPER